jgi:hypothetical protein
MRYQQTTETLPLAARFQHFLMIGRQKICEIGGGSIRFFPDPVSLPSTLEVRKSLVGNYNWSTLGYPLVN